MTKVQQILPLTGGNATRPVLSAAMPDRRDVTTPYPLPVPRQKSGLRREITNKFIDNDNEITVAQVNAKRSVAAWQRLAGRKESITLFGSGRYNRRTSLEEFIEVAVSKLEEKEGKNKWAISPDTTVMRKWDTIVMMLLVFTSIVTPFEVAFLPSRIDSLFWINRIVDACFIADMVIQCHLRYMDHDNKMVEDLRLIRQKYFKSWFVIDLVSIMPFDIVAIAGNKQSLGHLKVLRVVRLLRLSKLVRILRSFRVFQKIWCSFGWSHSTLALTKFVVLIFLLIHWICCVWRMTPLFSALWYAGNMHTTWLSNDVYFAEYTDWDSQKGEHFFNSHSDYSVLVNMYAYIAGLEFALHTLVIGYGEYRPTNPVERMIAILVFMVGGATYAYVIAATCGIISQLDMASQVYNSDMDLLNAYISERSMPEAIAVKIRQYFSHCKTIYRSKYYQKVFAKLSPPMQGQIAVFEHGRWLSGFSFFNAQDLHERCRFVTAVSRIVRMGAYARGERVFARGDRAKEMFIVYKGLIGCENRVFTQGKCFGIEMILFGARRRSDATALCFADTYTLARTTLVSTLANGHFPQTAKLVRQKAIWLGVRALMLRITKLRRATEGYVQPTREYRERRRRYYQKLAEQREKARKERKSESKLKAAALTATPTREVGNRAAANTDEGQTDENVEIIWLDLSPAASHREIATAKKRRLSQDEINKKRVLIAQELAYLRMGYKQGYTMPPDLQQHMEKQAMQKRDSDYADHGPTERALKKLQYDVTSLRTDLQEMKKDIVDTVVAALRPGMPGS